MSERIKPETRLVGLRLFCYYLRYEAASPSSPRATGDSCTIRPDAGRGPTRKIDHGGAEVGQVDLLRVEAVVSVTRCGRVEGASDSGPTPKLTGAPGFVGRLVPGQQRVRRAAPFGQDPQGKQGTLPEPHRMGLGRGAHQHLPRRPVPPVPPPVRHEGRTEDRHGRAMAAAHTLIVIIWHVLAETTAYNDLGSDYFTRRIHTPDARKHQLIRELEALGHKVTLEPNAAWPVASIDHRPTRRPTGSPTPASRCVSPLHLLTRSSLRTRRHFTSRLVTHQAL